MDNPASEQISNYFQECCDEFDKLFLPDAAKDEGIINNLIKFYKKHHDKEFLEECIRWFCRTEDGPILVMDFAINSLDVRDKVMEDRESRKEFNALLKQTEQRMKGFNELRD